jgi:hypothetical protein
MEEDASPVVPDRVQFGVDLQQARRRIERFRRPVLLLFLPVLREYSRGQQPRSGRRTRAKTACVSWRYSSSFAFSRVFCAATASLDKRDRRTPWDCERDQAIGGDEGRRGPTIAVCQVRTGQEVHVLPNVLVLNRPPQRHIGHQRKLDAS